MESKLYVTTDDIQVVAYSQQHANSIAEHLFDGVPEEIVRKQREDLLKPGPEEVFSVCALHESRVIGVSTGVRMRWAGSRHRIEMVQVVVSEQFRGRGIARRMMQSIAEHFSQRGVEIVQISAEADNTEALAAYERIGFQKFGVLQDGIKHNGQYSNEIMMAAPIATML
jgi:ribosomal protein S18 acetylase RimI-like enzyme